MHWISILSTLQTFLTVHLVLLSETREQNTTAIERCLSYDITGTMTKQTNSYSSPSLDLRLSNALANLTIL